MAADPVASFLRWTNPIKFSCVAQAIGAYKDIITCKARWFGNFGFSRGHKCSWCLAPSRRCGELNISWKTICYHWKCIEDLCWYATRECPAVSKCPPLGVDQQRFSQTYPRGDLSCVTRLRSLGRAREPGTRSRAR